MEVRVHGDPGEYWTLARPVFARDPMRHTHGLSVGRRMLAAPLPGSAPPILLTLWDGGQIAGAAFRETPWPLGVSAVPAGAGAEATANTMLELDPGLPSAGGPRDAAEPFAEVWSKLTGATVREKLAMRLYRLGTLEPPTGPGQAGLAGESDLALLTEWRTAFELEAVGEQRSPERADAMLRQSMALGNGHVLWQDGGQVVSYAAVGSPVDRMSRIGPVYTPPELRGRGYGSAVTAAASQWALDAGAEYVVLFTDLANPVSNSIYQRIGFRPVYDQTELEFDGSR